MAENRKTKHGKMLATVVMAALVSVLDLAPVAAETISARLGVMVNSADQCRRARATDEVKSGDLLRIYVAPPGNHWVYLVHNDGKVATLLLSTATDASGPLLTAPSSTDFYQVDGQSAREELTIVCAPVQVAEMKALQAAGQLPSQRWAAIEEQLLDRGRLKLTQDPSRPISLMGNVRGIPKPDRDPFRDKLLTYSGQTLLVKKFVFTVVR